MFGALKDFPVEDRRLQGVAVFGAQHEPKHDAEGGIVGNDAAHDLSHKADASDKHTAFDPRKGVHLIVLKKADFNRVVANAEDSLRQNWRPKRFLTLIYTVG